MDDLGRLLVATSSRSCAAIEFQHARTAAVITIDIREISLEKVMPRITNEFNGCCRSIDYNSSLRRHGMPYREQIAVLTIRSRNRSILGVEHILFVFDESFRVKTGRLVISF